MRTTRTLILALLLAFTSLAFAPLSSGAVVETPTTLFEDFESFVSGQDPSDSHYTFTEANCSVCSVSQVSPVAGFSSLSIATTSAVGMIDWAPSSVDFCDGMSFRWQYVPQSSSATFEIGLVSTTAAVLAGQSAQSTNIGEKFIVYTQVDDSILLYISGATSGSHTAWTVPSAEFTSADGVLMNVTVDSITCSSTQWKGRFKLEKPGDSYQVAFAHSGAGFATSGVTKFYGRTAATGEILVDNLLVTRPEEPAEPDASFAVTALTSFDVDRNGNVIIARTNGGEFVRTIEPKDPDGTLEQLGSRDTDCTGINDGVMAQDEVVAYLFCDPATDADQLEIRAFDLTQPDLGCDVTDECATDIDLDGSGFCSGFADSDNMQQIDEFQEFPLTYTVTRDALIGDDQLAVAWGYADSSRYIGVAQYTTRIGCDDYALDRELFGAAQPTDICAWTTNGAEADGNLTGTFIGGVEGSSSTKFYRYTSSVNADGNLDGVLSAPTAYLGLSSGVGIACATDYAIIARTTATNNIVLLDTFSGATVWQKTVASVSNQGVAISYDGQFVAYYDGTCVNLAYRFNGTVIGCLTPPSGSLRGIELDFNGQNAWVATTDNVAWYNLEQQFPGQIPGGCAGFDCEPGAEPPSTVPPGLEQFGLAVAALFGSDDPAVGLFLFGLFLLIVAFSLGWLLAGGFVLFRKGKAKAQVPRSAVWFGLFLAILMFFGNWVIGFFSTPVVVGTLILGVIGIFFAPRPGASSD